MMRERGDALLFNLKYIFWGTNCKGLLDPFLLDAFGVVGRYKMTQDDVRMSFQADFRFVRFFFNFVFKQTILGSDLKHTHTHTHIHTHRKKEKQDSGLQPGRFHPMYHVTTSI